MRILFASYGESQMKLPAEPGMLFCDFSPHASRVGEFVKAGSLVLDHHKTARPLVEAFGANGVFGDEVTQPGVSGAWLAYEQVWLPLMGVTPRGLQLQGFAHSFARLAGIRDTWQVNNPDWKDACIQARVLNFWSGATLLSKSLGELSSAWAAMVDVGALLEEQHKDGTIKAVAGSLRWTSKLGTRVVLLMSSKYISDATDLLSSEADLVVGFHFVVESGNPNMVLSTRSRGTYDCSALCKHYGGGGHTDAAGFTMSTWNNPFESILSWVSNYEVMVNSITECPTGTPER